MASRKRTIEERVRALEINLFVSSIAIVLLAIGAIVR